MVFWFLTATSASGRRARGRSWRLAGDIKTGGDFLSSSDEGSCPIWKDCDGDGKTGGIGDCDEGCSTCYEGSSAYTTVPDGKDQNCNLQVDEQVLLPKSCTGYGASSVTNCVWVSRPNLESFCTSYCNSIGVSFISSSGTYILPEITNCGDNCVSINFSNCAISEIPAYTSLQFFYYLGTVAVCGLDASVSCSCGGLLQ